MLEYIWSRTQFFRNSDCGCKNVFQFTFSKNKNFVLVSKIRNFICEINTFTGNHVYFFDAHNSISTLVSYILILNRQFKNIQEDAREIYNPGDIFDDQKAQFQCQGRYLARCRSLNEGGRHA